MIIISSQIGLHENVVALDYDREYANLIVNHNLSYEPVTLDEGGKGIVVQQQHQQSNKQKGLLPTIVERFLKRRLHFKRMLKQLPKESMEYVWCEHRVNSLKNILVCLYGSTGSLWNRCGNVLAFEEINKLSRDILIRTKDVVQQLGYELTTIKQALTCKQIWSLDNGISLWYGCHKALEKIKTTMKNIFVV
jgi:DNA polymerase elongation subunit (family B)